MNAQTLRTASLALVYSSAECCAPVWLNSAHVHKLDVQLNNLMRLITGTVKSTELQWLPVLSNIAPPKLQQEAALFRELKNNRINGKSSSFKMFQRWDSVQETQFGLTTLAPPILSMIYWNVEEKCSRCRLQFTVT
jgi:hypothetical protein